MTTLNPSVDKYIDNLTQWSGVTKALRKIAVQCKLSEEVKWRKPCYSYDGKNIVIIQGFKDYCALLFFKGSLLKDPENILEKTGPNSRVGRQIRFTSVKQVADLEQVVKAYIREAIEIEKAGLKTPAPVADEIEIPSELQHEMDADPVFRKAFDALTPGRQRGYIFHISGAKKSETRAGRIKKNKKRIMQGKGIHDR